MPKSIAQQREEEQLNVKEPTTRLRPQDSNYVWLYEPTSGNRLLARCDSNGNLRVTAIVPGGVDVIDRWNREVGQVDLARYNGAAAGPANPLDTNPSDRWARQVGQMDLARVLGAALAHGNPVIARLTDGSAFIDPREFRPPGTLQAGTRTTTIGVAVPIHTASVTIYNSVLVQADLDNTGRILLGNAATRPVELEAGDVAVCSVDNVQDVYFDVTVNGERVNWLAA